jgi:hypothetical protein
MSQENSDPETLLEQAAEWELRSVVVVGVTESGDFVWATTTDHAAEILYMLKTVEYDLMAKTGPKEYDHRH